MSLTDEQLAGVRHAEEKAPTFRTPRYLYVQRAIAGLYIAGGIVAAVAAMIYYGAFENLQLICIGVFLAAALVAVFHIRWFKSFVREGVAIVDKQVEHCRGFLGPAHTRVRITVENRRGTRRILRVESIETFRVGDIGVLFRLDNLAVGFEKVNVVPEARAVVRA